MQSFKAHHLSNNSQRIYACLMGSVYAQIDKSLQKEL